jgi:hypothetical protein
MDQEFINVYIQRMLALNSELTNKNIMLETKLSIVEKRYAELLPLYESLKQQHESLLQGIQQESDVETDDANEVQF